VWRTKQAGKTEAKLPAVRFYNLGHTVASLLLNHGISALVVSKILGHSNPSVTLTIYAHSSLDMQSEAVKIMEEIVNPIQFTIERWNNVAAR
jgi:integrase